jgi:hypothetical protein
MNKVEITLQCHNTVPMKKVHLKELVTSALKLLAHQRKHDALLSIQKDLQQDYVEFFHAKESEMLKVCIEY